MHDSLAIFIQKKLRNITQAIINLFIFLPYFFSVGRLLKTLLAPWKNIVTKKTKPGLSMAELKARLADNFVSRFMGFSIRASILAAYLFIQLLFIFSLPFLYIGALVLLPFAYLLYKSQPAEEQKKQQLYDNFTKRHLAEPADKAAVDIWFARYFEHRHQIPWWNLKRLMKTPPLGRDLTTGFTPNLDRYAAELTLIQPHYQYLIGRKQEIEVTQRILSKSGDANVILVGEQGTGRRTIVEALAKMIYEGSSNPQLAYKRVLELDMAKILAEQTDFIKREEALAALFQEAVDAKNIIIMIVNLDQFVSSDKDDVNLSTVIAKYAQSNVLQFIGITTPYLYQKHIFNNKPIAEVFEKVDVTEMSLEQALTVLLDVTIELEKRHSVVITYSALKQAVVQTDRYISTSPLPEKAIELLDESCLFVKQQLKSSAVTAHVINTVLEQKIHIPTEVDSSIKNKLLHLEETLLQRVVYQNEAIEKLSAALRKSFVMVGARKKPLASFLFLGPTGVGKTETAKAVTEVFFDSVNNMIRFDMSLYQSKQDIVKLIGSAETREPGLLTEAIRQKRYGTLLLDELEKADSDLINIFLTILDEGYFTDGLGKKVDCTNLIIIATSNAGADYIYQFVTKQPQNIGAMASGLIDFLIQQKIYSPEFLNRFDGVVVYKPLSPEAIKIIAEKILQTIQQDAATKHQINLKFSQEFVNNLISQGYDPRFGARNMQRIIREQIEDKVAKIILEGSINPGQTINF